MKTKKRNGFVIELMIGFMLVTFATCTVITVYVTSLATARKTAKNDINNQIVLNQIGEYFMRSVEAGGVFPKDNTGLTYAKYSWMDDNGDKVLDNNDETVKFFKDHGGYTYSDKISAEYGNILDFYATKAVTRRLAVMADGKRKMVLTVKENYIDDNTSACDVLTWYVGKDLDVPDDEQFKETNLNILQLLWKFFGKLNGDIRDAELFTSLNFRDIFTFFDITITDWNDIITKALAGGVVT